MWGRVPSRPIASHRRALPTQFLCVPPTRSPANTGSAAFFIALIVSQWGHLISVRRRTPYFSDAILNTDQSPDGLATRLWKELLDSRPRPQIVGAILASAIVGIIFTEIPAMQTSCQTGSVPKLYWGYAIGKATHQLVLCSILPLTSRLLSPACLLPHVPCLQPTCLRLPATSSLRYDLTTHKTPTPASYLFHAGFSALWFVAGELRKWLILLYPDSVPAKLTKW